MIERFRPGDLVRIVALSDCSDEDQSLLGREAVFGFYSEPNQQSTGWEVVVYTDEEPGDACVWVVDERAIEATGYLRDPLGHRMPIGLRTPEVADDVVGLRLVSGLTTEAEAVAFEAEARAYLSRLVAAERIVIALDRRFDEDRIDEDRIELHVSLPADDGADALFDALVALCPTGWEFADDGWRRDGEWEPHRADAGDVFVHASIFYAAVWAQPWSRLMRRRVAMD